MAARKLPQRARLLIVKALAGGSTPMEVVRLIEKEFGLTITRQTVEHYDPTKSHQLSPTLTEYYLEQSRQTGQELDTIGLEQRAYRQRLRAQLLEKCVGNPKLQLAILDSAAKEAAGLFQTKRPRQNYLRPAARHPSQESQSLLEAMTIQQLEAFIADLETRIQELKERCASQAQEKAIEKTL